MHTPASKPALCVTTLTGALTAALLLAIPSPAAAATTSPPTVAQYCAPLPPQTSILESDLAEDVLPNGLTRWTSTVIYTLSTGQTAEAVLSYTSDQVGDVSFAIDGEVVVFVRYAAAPDDSAARLGHGFGTQSWASPSLALQQEVTAELLQESVGQVLMRGLVPQEMKCSKFGKGVIAGMKYLWIGATAAAGAACCAGTGIVGCGACATGAAAAGFAGVDAANGHCD
jgi:hypothetical protein